MIKKFDMEKVTKEELDFCSEFTLKVNKKG
jgi:hypothetical protein